MSADLRRLNAGIVVWLLVSAAGATAAAADDPDVEFLEYLGSWEGSDEDWLMFQELATDETGDDDDEVHETESAGVPETDAKESTESLR